MCLLFPAPASAFDGDREGFFTSLGLGVAAVSYKDKVTQGSSVLGYHEETQAAFFWDGRIGYGLSNRTVAYLDVHSVWFNMELAPSISRLVTDYVGGIGIMYFTSPQAPSVMVNAGAGFSLWNTWHASGIYHTVASRRGGGGWFGAGYEFTEGWMVEGSVAFGNPSRTVSDVKGTTKSTMFGFCLSTMVY